MPGVEAGEAWGPQFTSCQAWRSVAKLQFRLLHAPYALVELMVSVVMTREKTPMCGQDRPGDFDAAHRIELCHTLSQMHRWYCSFVCVCRCTDILHKISASPHVTHAAVQRPENSTRQVPISAPNIQTHAHTGSRVSGAGSPWQPHWVRGMEQVNVTLR
jgi:hypothetical protein